MNSSGWQQAKRLFQQASAINGADQRAAFLDAQIADASLRQEVEALLAAHGSADSFLEQPAFTEAAEVVSQQHETHMIGRRFGVWRIQRFLDRGGMGAVYLAERAEGGFRQLAALKLLRPGLVHAEVIRRFEQERQILAGLDHPNIAKLLDGGNTDDGQPWLVMEYVDGVPIDRWCEDRRLNSEARVGLLRRVADAVQFAHQHLVVHRDLKPSNILVTANGAPKLLDFGVAKLMRADPDSTQRHATVAPMLTPDYASPEQVRGDPVSSASDVYALGVLLFRLLSGVQPYHISSTSPGELLAKICEQEPVKPSVSLRNTMRDDPELAQRIANARQTRPKRLLRILQGDLDTITLTALRKEPARRYATPGLLAADLSRWENALPVNARPDSVGYRGAKFVRRHKVGLAAAAAVLLAMLTGLGAALWQAERATAAQQRAEARFDDTHQLANALVFDLHDAIADLPGSTKARHLLVQRALVYLEKLRANATGEPQLLADLAAAYLKIGDVQGHPEESSLGNLVGAVESYRKSLAIRRELVILQPASARAQHELAGALDRVAYARWWQDDTESALTFYRQALAARKSARDLGGDGPEYIRGLAATREGQARVLAWDNQYAQAMAGFNLAVGIRKAQFRVDPGNPERARELAKALNMRGYAQVWQQSRMALDDHERAIAVAEQALKANPRHQPLRLTLVRSRTRLAQALRHFKRYDAAIVEHQRALASAEALVSSDPNDANAKTMLAWSQQAFGETCIFAGRIACAEEHARAALALHQQLATANPDDSGLQEDLANGHQTVADVLVMQFRYDEARAAYHEALTVQQRRLLAQPDVASLHRAVAGVHLDLGELEYNRASGTPLPRTEHDAALRVALKEYDKYLDRYEYLESHDAVPPADLTIIEQVRARVVEVNRLLASKTDT